MTKEKLLKLLKAHEWNDVEFKEARREVPKSVYETVSAFANANGGWIVFGVTLAKDDYQPVGVELVDKVQNDFLSALRADNKVNHDIGVKESLITIDGKSVLAFYIPESPRHHKPIYLHGDIRQTFIRRGGGDQKASMPEIERLLRDSAQDRWDGQIFDFPLEEALDKKSIHWYRNRFYQINPGHDEDISDNDFLYEWGYLVKQSRKLRPTRAAIMLFGTSTAIHHIIPRPTLDVQWIPANIEDPQPEMRWLDRVVYEENIIKTWQGLVAKYYQYEPRPFTGIDPR